MRELQVKRLEAVIRAKEARLQALRGGRGPEAENYPPNDVPPPVVEVPPPPVRRQSSELINIEQATPNDAPLGKLQVAGRSDYTATLPMPAFGLHGIRRDSSQDRGGLQPSGLPSRLVERWFAGYLSADMALLTCKTHARQRTYNAVSASAVLLSAHAAAAHAGGSYVAALRCSQCSGRA